jgi:uncharacterized short protein YbdD (DUF466 family)
MRSTRAWLLRAGAVVRRVIGVPDYDRYLAHAREYHPATEPLTREQFISACMHARYDQPGSRCC